MDEVADLGRTEPLVTSPPVLPRPPVDAALLDGVHASIERLDADRHARDLWHAIGSRTDLWSEVPPGPFMTEDDFKDWLASRSAQAGQALYAIVDRRSGRAAGLFLVLRIDPAMGTLEIGLVYGAALQRTTSGTEAFFLLADYLLSTLGYRRLEWRCNTTNLASQRAAERFGLTREGTLRQTMFLKGRTWDTALYGLIDRDWPGIRARFAAWLAADNFGADGEQLKPLSAF
jgi:RimJ/RimL family protein N-acetyltransferase